MNVMFLRTLKTWKLDYVLGNKTEGDKVWNNYSRLKKKDVGFAYATILELLNQ